MSKLNAKNQIYLLIASWFLGICFMFFYGFDILNRKNKTTQEKIDAQKKELAVLEVERRSYEQAKRDLQNIGEKPLQPQDFFSRDVTLVKEIEILESLEKKISIDSALGGISGIVGSAPKAKTIGDIAILPFSVSLSGSFNQAMEYLEALENLPFATNISSISIRSASEGRIVMGLVANLYARK